MFSQKSFTADAYKQVSLDTEVQTADPHRLILLLLDGAIAALNEAKLHLQSGQVGKKGSCISKAIDIIANGLKVSIDMESGGDLAEKLVALYDYMVSRLLWANMKNDMSTLDEVLGLLGEIHGAWVSIDPSKSPLTP